MFEKTYADASGWPMRVGSRVKVTPRSIQDGVRAPKAYFGIVADFVDDEDGDVLVVVRAEKNQATRNTRPSQARVVKPGQGMNEKLLRARLRGEERRRK